jgi:hypothetical protein
LLTCGGISETLENSGFIGLVCQCFCNSSLSARQFGLQVGELSVAGALGLRSQSQCLGGGADLSSDSVVFDGPGISNLLLLLVCIICGVIGVLEWLGNCICLGGLGIGGLVEFLLSSVEILSGGKLVGQ